MVDKKYFGLQKKKITNSIKVKVFLLNFFHILKKLLKFDAKSLHCIYFFFFVYIGSGLIEKEKKKCTKDCFSSIFYVIRIKLDGFFPFHTVFVLSNSFIWMMMIIIRHFYRFISIILGFFLSFFALWSTLEEFFLFWLLLNSSICIFNKNKKKLMKFS